MPFNSLKYFLFLPFVYLTFYFLGYRARWVALLAASFFFYAALNASYLLVVLMLVIITTYGFGIWLGQADTSKTKLYLLWGGIAANVLILFFMKYLPFISVNLKALVRLFSLNAHIQPIVAFVAIGVSYYIFQAISYLIDIYLGILKPERHLGYFALSLAFFPKLLQGPIERTGNLVPQLKVKYEFNYNNMRSGMLLLALGLLKKVVIADRLGLYVNAVYDNAHDFTGVPLLLATYAYAFQIYMDFSGYTDMALGSARLFNINLTQNFNSPYIATSIADFWRRWHISFSSWILDYIFKPLQMQWRNWKNWGTAVALIVTFFISGIWHGASWGFVIWGLLHGVYLACSVFYRPFQKKLHKALGVEKTKLLKIWQIFVTFNLVSFAWIFFRANNVHSATYIAKNIFTGLPDLFHNIVNNQSAVECLGPNKKALFLSIIFIIFLEAISYFQRKIDIFYIFNQQPIYIRWIVYYGVIFTILFLGIFNNSQFIYAKF